MPRTCSICNHTLVEALQREIRPGRSFRELAEEFSVSRSALYRHVREKHHEPSRLFPAKPPNDPPGCAICRMGPETRELVLQARRKERSIRALAVAVGVSRSAMRWHLRDCVPAVLGLTRCDPSGSQIYRPRAVIDALARIDKRTK